MKYRFLKEALTKGNIGQNPLKFYMQLFWCWWPNEVIEGSVCKQRAHIVMKHEVMFISSRQILLKSVKASLESFAFQW